VPGKVMRERRLDSLPVQLIGNLPETSSKIRDARHLYEQY